MSDTPRTDRVIKNCNGWHHVPIEHARELERELNAAKARIARLEEAGNDMAKHAEALGMGGTGLVRRWNEAKS